MPLTCDIPKGKWRKSFGLLGIVQLVWYVTIFLYVDFLTRGSKSVCALTQNYVYSKVYNICFSYKEVVLQTVCWRGNHKE